MSRCCAESPRARRVAETPEPTTAKRALRARRSSSTTRATTTRPSPSSKTPTGSSRTPTCSTTSRRRYERLLEYAQSVEWFERYLAEAPPDAEFRTVVENRLRVLRNLPARISVTTIPEHVHAALVDAAASDVRGRHADGVQGAGRRLHDRARRSRAGRRSRHDVTAEHRPAVLLSISAQALDLARCTIFTRPRGARVFIDDGSSARRRSPARVEVGKHKLLLEHPDYPWHREELDVQPGAPLKREIKLTRPVRSGRTELVIGVDGLRRRGRAAAGRSALSSNSQLRHTRGSACSSTARRRRAGHRRRLPRLVPRHAATASRSATARSSSAAAAWGTSFGAVAGARARRARRSTSTALAIARQRLGITTGVAGRALARHLAPATPRIVNSGGIWGTATGALLAQAIFRNPSRSAVRLVHPRRHHRSACSPGRCWRGSSSVSRGHVGAHRRRRPGRHRPRLRARLRHRRQLAERGRRPGRRALRARRHGARPARRRGPDAQVQGRPPAGRGAARDHEQAAGRSAFPRSPSSRRSRPKASRRASRSRSPKEPGRRMGPLLQPWIGKAIVFGLSRP